MKVSFDKLSKESAGKRQLIAAANIKALTYHKIISDNLWHPRAIGFLEFN